MLKIPLTNQVRSPYYKLRMGQVFSSSIYFYLYYKSGGFGERPQVTGNGFKFLMHAENETSRLDIDATNSKF